MQRDEEDGAVAAEDRLGAVPMVDVEVDDGHPLEPELGLRVARRHRGVVDQAKAHRPVGERVMPRWSDEREATPVDRLESDPRGERRRLPRGLGSNRVRVELHRSVDPPQQREVVGHMHACQLFLACVPLDRFAAEPKQPVLPLRVRPSRVETRKREVGQELDSASRRPASLPNPHSSASAAARAHVGS